MKRRPLVAAAAGVVLVAGCGVAYAQGQSSSGSYRTAMVTSGDVDETLSLAGTITASARRDLSFGASGTVDKVKVAPGDVVRSGSTLATLEPADLNAAVTKARAAVARAKAQLESDQTSQASAVTAAESSSSSSSGGSNPKEPAGSEEPSSSPPDDEATSSPALAKVLAQLKSQQAAVTAAQTEATQSIAAAKAALAAQAEACADATGVNEPEPNTADGGATPPAVSFSAECTGALDAIRSAQDAVAGKQDVLQAALQKLSGTLDAAVKAVGASTGSSGGGSQTPEPAPTVTPDAPSTGSSGGAGGGGVSVTAATLAKDQASIDTARAELAEAKQLRNAAELTAPFAGEVLSVSIVKGNTVGQADVAIVMTGTGSTTATTTVTLEQVAEVEEGQVAQVTPAGASRPVSGTVTSIGLLPDTSSDTSSYPVTIDLGDDVGTPEGATASISLVTGTATDVLTVPSSAVSTTGRTTVSLLAGGAVVRTPVTVGVIGSARTEITAGVTKGQVVVLADLNAALPSGDDTTTRLPGSGGGFSGGDVPGGGRMQGRRG